MENGIVFVDEKAMKRLLEQVRLGEMNGMEIVGGEASDDCPLCRAMGLNAPRLDIH